MVTGMDWSETNFICTVKYADFLLVIHCNLSLAFFEIIFPKNIWATTLTFQGHCDVIERVLTLTLTLPVNVRALTLLSLALVI